MKGEQADEAPGAGQLSLLAGRVSLDFANTISGQSTPFEIDHLTSLTAFEIWLRHAAVPNREVAVDSDLPKDPGSFRRVQALREAINRIGTALVQSRAPEAEDLATLNKVAGRGLPHLRLEQNNEHQFFWATPPSASIDAILAWLALDAADVLRFSDLTRLRRCLGEDCGWLFLDTSKSGRRRWCDMTVCGNRAKARRHRAKLTCTTMA